MRPRWPSGTSRETGRELTERIRAPEDPAGEGDQRNGQADEPCHPKREPGGCVQVPGGARTAESWDEKSQRDQ